MDACCVRCFVRRTKTRQRTAKSCGPGAATLASIHAAPWWRGNGDNKGRSPGRARISRKAIARGKRNGKKFIQINAVWLVCRYLCRDPLKTLRGGPRE